MHDPITAIVEVVTAAVTTPVVGYLLIAAVALYALTKVISFTAGAVQQAFDPKLYAALKAGDLQEAGMQHFSPFAQVRIRELQDESVRLAAKRDESQDWEEKAELGETLESMNEETLSLMVDDPERAFRLKLYRYVGYLNVTLAFLYMALAAAALVAGVVVTMMD